MLKWLKEPSLEDDLRNKRPSALARAVTADRLTYLSPEAMARLERSIEHVVRSRVPGDFLEFGVALGGSAIVLAAAARQAKRAFHGFDVFAMIPEPTSDKDDDKSRSRYSTIKSGTSQGIGGDEYYGYRKDLYADVLSAFQRHGVPVDGKGIVLHKGLFEATWSERSAGDVAFAHVDCDWYDPVKFCLDRLGAAMPSGGVIAVDDYNTHSGSRTATDEFLAAHRDFRMLPGPNILLVRS